MSSSDPRLTPFSPARARARSRPAIAIALAAAATISSIPDPSLALAQLAAASVPAPAPPPPLPPARRGLVWAGATLFVLPYLASTIAATTGYVNAADTTSTRGFLWIPAAGPFIMMGNTSSAAADVLLVFDGLAQLGGLTMFFYGMTLPKSGADPKDSVSRVEVSIAPLVSRSASGATLVATF